MNERLQPAFWGGVFIGVLSALPLVSAGNCCCCLWVLCGGALAAYLRQQNTPYPDHAGRRRAPRPDGRPHRRRRRLGPGDPAADDDRADAAADDGAGARPSNPDVPPEVREWLAWVDEHVEHVGDRAPRSRSSIYAVFGTLGGLFGAAIFKKTPPPAPPGDTIDVPPYPGAMPPPVDMR